MPMLQDDAKTAQVTLRDLERIVGDISLQPIWRPEADRAADYYDGRQLEPDVVREMEARGQPVLIHNLIQPAINGVLGLEAKTRTDWKVVADDEDKDGEEQADVAEAMNMELNKAARMTRANRACSDAFAAQVKTGMGWVEVTRNGDPFAYPYEVNYIHRREIFWDWHARKPDLADARWMLRRKWLEQDELIMAFPQHKRLIEAMSNGFIGYDPWQTEEPLLYSQELLGAYTDQTTTSIPEDQWWDPDRRRALVYEIYYRVWEKKPVLKTQDGQVFEFDKQSKIHQAVLANGQAEVVIAPYSKMRLSYFIGPHRVADLDSPHPHNKFPYIPFWGYKEDRTEIPYGIVRGMMPAQDEINKRRSRLTWLLNAKLIIKDEDSVLDMNDDEIMDAVHSGFGVISMNPNRQNKNSDAFKVQTDMGVAQQQFTVMQEAEKMIQDVAGIYNSFLGADSGAQSGVAIDSLIEQSSTTLAEMNDNYRYSRQLLGELLLDHIVADIGENQKDVQINKDNHKKTRTIRLNERREDGFTKKVTNQVVRTRMNVVMDEVANTKTYRQQLARGLMEMAGQMPDQIKMALIDMIVELSDIPSRDEVLKRIRQATGQGVDPEDMTEEEQAQMQRKQQLQQEMEELEIENKRLEVQELAAKARKLNAESQEKESLTEHEQNKLIAEYREINARIKEIVTNVAKARKDLYQTIDGEIELESKRLPGSAPQEQGEQAP